MTDAQKTDQKTNQKIAHEDTRIFNLELLIAKFLRYGVLFAGFLIFVGWMSQIDLHHDVFARFQTYTHVPLATALQTIIADHNWGLLTAYLGLGVLISLPITRVALVAFVFLSERDYVLAVCAFIVLFGLALSFVLGYEI